MTVLAEYGRDIIVRLFEQYAANPKVLRESIADMRAAVPPPLSHGKERPNKADAINAFRTRFAQ